jgi:Domain of unknown function (DUF4352)
MHSQPPGRRGRDNQPPGPDGPYEQEPPRDPYQQQQWQPQSGLPYQPPPNGPHNQPPWEPSYGTHQQPRPNGPYQELPPGGPYQQPPGAPYQSQPPRKRRLGLKITLGIVGGVILLIIVAAALGGGNSGSSGSTSTTSSGTSAAPAQAAAPAPGIGTKVRDGKFEFVITKVTHAKSVGDTSLGLGDTAQGEYTILHIRVTNIGTEAQTLDDSAQYVYDSAGRKFSASTSADIDLGGVNGQSSTWFDDINPGNSVHGRIAFDLPAGDKAVKAELHDSAFSDGITVKLG